MSTLNPEQLKAVAHRDGPLKIVAGAGTGKTGTLTRRFGYLVYQGVPADRILTLTFSRRAAGEFRERVLKLLDSSYPRLWISTFHGFCLRVLREERDRFGAFGVLSESEQRRIIARAVRDDPEADSRRYYVGESGAVRLVADALTLISRTKDEAISLADFAEYADRRGIERLRELANVYVMYEDLCRNRHKLDFGDLGSFLVEAFQHDVELLGRWQEKFDHIMVDEFQDTNEAQWRLLTLLAQYTYRYDRKERRLRDVNAPQLFQTLYASPQYELWEMDDEQWRKIARRPYERQPPLAATGLYQLDLPNMAFPKTLPVM